MGESREFNLANFRIQSYTLLYLDFDENVALKLAKIAISFVSDIDPGTISDVLRLYLNFGNKNKIMLTKIIKITNLLQVKFKFFQKCFKSNSN